MTPGAPPRVDRKRLLKHLYAPSAKAPAIVEVPALPYLMIDGQGDPNTSQDYQAAIEALFAVSYALKFSLRRAPAGPTTS